MVEASVLESKHAEDVIIPNIKVENKENITRYFRLLIASTPRFKFSITDKDGKEQYSNFFNVEMR